MPEGIKLTKKQLQSYVDALAVKGRKIAAVEGLGFSYSAVRNWRRFDPTFDKACDEAMDRFRESLEAETHRRGVEGTLEPVFYKGCKIADVKKYSDRLLELLLKRHIPEFRDKLQVDANVKGGVLVVGEAAATSEEWSKKWKKKNADSEDRAPD